MERPHPLKAFRDRQTPPLSQKQLADMLNVSRISVVRWETGARNVDIDRLTTISELTGIAPADLRPDLAELMQTSEAAE